MDFTKAKIQYRFRWVGPSMLAVSCIFPEINMNWHIHGSRCNLEAQVTLSFIQHLCSISGNLVLHCNLFWSLHVQCLPSSDISHQRAQKFPLQPAFDFSWCLKPDAENSNNICIGKGIKVLYETATRPRTEPKTLGNIVGFCIKRPGKGSSTPDIQNRYMLKPLVLNLDEGKEKADAWTITTSTDRRRDSRTWSAMKCNPKDNKSCRNFIILHGVVLFLLLGKHVEHDRSWKPMSGKMVFWLQLLSAAQQL